MLRTLASTLSLETIEQQIPSVYLCPKFITSSIPCHPRSTPKMGTAATPALQRGEAGSVRGGYLSKMFQRGSGKGRVLNATLAGFSLKDILSKGTGTVDTNQSRCGKGKRHMGAKGRQGTRDQTGLGNGTDGNKWESMPT